MVIGVRLQVRPEDGEIEELRDTVPRNPLSDWTVIVDVPETPALTLSAVGLAETEKSGTAIL